jgi:hypothetical protein
MTGPTLSIGWARAPPTPPGSTPLVQLTGEVPRRHTVQGAENGCLTYTRSALGPLAIEDLREAKGCGHTSALRRPTVQRRSSLTAGTISAGPNSGQCGVTALKPGQNESDHSTIKFARLALTLSGQYFESAPGSRNSSTQFWRRGI